MAPHQQRVIDEKNELDQKISKLRVFLDGKVFTGLDKYEQARLKLQVSVMDTYSQILGDRIANF